MTFLVCQRVPRAVQCASRLGALSLVLSGCPEQDGDRGGSASLPAENASDRDVQKGGSAAAPSPSWYACWDGLIPFAQVCDGTSDCETAEDEAGCDGTFVCDVEPGSKLRWEVFPESAWCDGTPQ